MIRWQKKIWNWKTESEISFNEVSRMLLIASDFVELQITKLCSMRVSQSELFVYCLFNDAFFLKGSVIQFISSFIYLLPQQINSQTENQQ
jgi:hypothetical protein